MIVGMNILNTSDVLFCKMYREDVWVITTAGQGIVLMKNDSECDQNILSTSSRHGNENDVLCRRIMCVHIQVLTRITAMPAAFLLLKWQVIYIYSHEISCEYMPTSGVTADAQVKVPSDEKQEI